MKLIVYDKAAWHIDAGEDKQMVLNHFATFMIWCQNNNLLSPDGKEIMELGVDDSISLHSGMFTENGNSFMQQYYDVFISSTEKDYEEMSKKLSIV